MGSYTAQEPGEAGALFFRECLANRFLLFALFADLFGEDPKDSELQAEMVVPHELGRQALEQGEGVFTQAGEAFREQAYANAQTWIKENPDAVSLVRDDFSNLVKSTNLTGNYH